MGLLGAAQGFRFAASPCWCKYSTRTVGELKVVKNRVVRGKCLEVDSGCLCA